jgi:hypothetical protein
MRSEECRAIRPHTSGHSERLAAAQPRVVARLLELPHSCGGRVALEYRTDIRDLCVHARDEVADYGYRRPR